MVSREPFASSVVEGEYPEILTSIYEEQINMVRLKRDLPDEVTGYCRALVESAPTLNFRAAISVQDVTQKLQVMVPELDGKAAFIEDLCLLIDMYSCLFDLEEVGIRMQVLDRAMCPRFHTDKLGCRLVTTYRGAGSEWLENDQVDRSKLGAGNKGLPDEESGVYDSESSIKSANAGDVLLLKGDGWLDNEGRGIVHRSPSVATGDKRIVLTMDFA